MHTQSAKPVLFLKFSFSRPTPESLTGVEQFCPAREELTQRRLGSSGTTWLPGSGSAAPPSLDSRNPRALRGKRTRQALGLAAPPTPLTPVFRSRPSPARGLPPPSRPPPPASSPPLHLVAAPESPRGIGTALLARGVGRPEGVAPRGAESRTAAVERRAEAAYRRPHQRPSPQPNKRASHSALPAACTAQTR